MTKPNPATAMTSRSAVEMMIMATGIQANEAQRAQLAEMLDSLRAAAAPPAPRPAPTVGVLVTRERDNLLAAVEAATALIAFYQAQRGIPTAAQVAERQGLEHAWLAACQALGREQPTEPSSRPQRNQRRR